MRARATRRFVLALAVLGLAAGCGHAPAKHYYTLTYPLPKAAFEKPFPYVVRVKELSVSPAYGGDRMVFRQDVSEIEYYQERRWTERPGRMVTDLVRRHLRQAGLVQQVTEKLGEKPPDFVLEGEIEAIEELDAGDETSARLALNLRLVRFDGDAVVWRRSFDERRAVPAGRGRAIVRALSDILESQLASAVESLGRTLAANAVGAPTPTAEAAPALTVPAPPPGAVVPEPASPLLQHPQLAADETPMPAGRGAVFLPSLSGSDREPPVTLLRDGRTVTEGRTGARIVVPPGVVEVRYGSGTGSQQGSATVVVEEGRVTAVQPAWSTLELRVVNERFIAFRGSYELIAMPGREEFGLGFGADEEQGEQVRVWMLKPGLYKIVHAGGTYRDRTNFATVSLEPGKHTRFALVVDPDTGDFKGAGVVFDEESGGGVAARWKRTLVVGGDVKVGRSGESAAPGWNVDLSLFLDGMARFLDEPHLFVSRLELEEGQLRPAGTRRFLPIIDRLYLHEIYTFHLLPWIGPYARVGLETKLLPRYKVYDARRDVEQLDDTGALVGLLSDVDLVTLGGPFAPLQLKEGVGGNLKAVHSSWLDLDLRLGVGARQYFARGEWAIDASSGVDRMRAVSSYHLEGVEGAVVGLARLSRWIALSTELDGLVPFGDFDNTVFTWRNQASLRLVSFASLNYLLNVTRDPNRRVGKITLWEQLVQLRFSYGVL